MLEIKSNKQSYGIKFPTSINEITPEVLKSITDHVKLPKHYCIVALCFRTDLFNFVTTIKSNKGSEVGVVSLLAKIHEEDTKSTDWNVGDRLIVDRSSIERGYHLNIPISINSGNAAAYLKNDEELRKDIMSGKYSEDSKNKNIYIVEFKIIPVNDIASAIPMNVNVIDPYKVSIGN